MERILKTTTPTAKKEHTCAVCGQTIHKGVRYLNVSILKDGKVERHTLAVQKRKSIKRFTIRYQPVSRSLSSKSMMIL